MERAMHGFDHDTAFRRVLRRVLALLGVSALILAAGLDHADAATTEPLKAGATAAMSWLAIAGLGIALFAVYRRTVPSRARRAAIARRREAARGTRRRPF
jgi:hypothetical protein